MKSKVFYDAAMIQKSRLLHNLTQEQLANALQCRQQTISEWCLGLYTPKSAYQQLLNLFFSDPEAIKEAQGYVPPKKGKNEA